MFGDMLTEAEAASAIDASLYRILTDAGLLVSREGSVRCVAHAMENAPSRGVASGQVGSQA